MRHRYFFADIHLAALTDHWTARSSNESVQRQPFTPGEGDRFWPSDGRDILWGRTAAPTTGEPRSRTCNSRVGIVNCVKPQRKQTASFGKTKTMDLSRPSCPEKWIATSPLKTLCLSEWHPLQYMATPDGITVPSALHRTHRLEPPSVAIVLSVNFTGDSPASTIQN